jgi:2,4-dienoyl-CoA reductase-like NADH-dependent reductase (Old Yellow Enzyme family)
MSHLFSSFKLRGVEYSNRVGVSPTCQYSGEGGFANDWHFAHLAARAARLVFTEAGPSGPRADFPQDLGDLQHRPGQPVHEKGVHRGHQTPMSVRRLGDNRRP